jgi:hypothetical protein
MMEIVRDTRDDASSMSELVNKSHRMMQSHFRTWNSNKWDAVPSRIVYCIPGTSGRQIAQFLDDSFGTFWDFWAGVLAISSNQAGRSLGVPPRKDESINMEQMSICICVCVCVCLCICIYIGYNILYTHNIYIYICTCRYYLTYIFICLYDIRL